MVQLFSQSITPNLSMGSEIFWLGHQRKSGIGFAARYNNDKMVSSNSCIYQYLVEGFRYFALCPNTVSKLYWDLLCNCLFCTEKVATGQVASTGIVALSYVQKVSEKVSICITITKAKKIFSLLHMWLNIILFSGFSSCWFHVQSYD